MTGAAALASEAALRSGAGVVTLAVPESLHDLMEMKLTEVMTQPIPEAKKGVIGGDKALAALLQMTDGYDLAGTMRRESWSGSWPDLSKSL